MHTYTQAIMHYVFTMHTHAHTYIYVTNIIIIIKGTVRQKKPFNTNNDFIGCEIMFIMRNRTTCHIKMADRMRIRSQAGRPRSFEEGSSNANKRTYILNKTFAEW